MTDISRNGDKRRLSRWRLATWSAAAILLLLPLVAMQFTDEVAWDVADFAFFGILLVGTGGVFELAAHKSGSTTYRTATGVALATAFLLVWVNAAVGIIGSEDNDANLMYFGVLAVGVVGGLIARFQPGGMARALIATALVQMLVAVIAATAQLGLPSSGPGEILFLNAFFAALWLTSAWLFWKAARDEMLDVHAFLSAMTTAIGCVLMAVKIYADSEPGAIPLLLIVFGAAWYTVSRVRARPNRVDDAKK